MKSITSGFGSTSRRSILIIASSWWLCLATTVVNGFVFQPAVAPPVGGHQRGRGMFLSCRRKFQQHHAVKHCNGPLRGVIRLRLSTENDSSSDNRQENNRIPQAAAARTASSSSSSPFSSMSMGHSHSLLSSKAILEAAASHTQESCRLLGVKSLGVDYGLVRTGLAMTIGFDPRPLAIIHSNTTTTEEVTRTVRNRHTNMDDVIVRQQVVQDMPSVAFVCDAILRHAAVQGNVSRIIVGLPLHKNGTIAQQTNRTLIFANELAKRATSQLGPQIQVFLWDERYTSKEAAARVHTASSSSSFAATSSGYGSNNNHRDLQSLYSGILDDEAACIILENYYHENGQGAHEVILSKAVQEECLRDFQRRQVETVVNRQAIQLEREEKIERKRLAIARDHQKQLEAERIAAAESAQSDGDAVTSKKKRKKKKKR